MSKDFSSRNKPKKETEQAPRIKSEDSLRVLSIKVDKDVHADLKILATKTGKSLKDVMNEAFVAYLEKHPLK